MSTNALERETIFAEFGVRTALPRSAPASTRGLTVILVRIRQQSHFDHSRGFDPQRSCENAFHRPRHNNHNTPFGIRGCFRERCRNDLLLAGDNRRVALQLQQHLVFVGVLLSKGRALLVHKYRIHRHGAIRDGDRRRTHQETLLHRQRVQNEPNVVDIG